MKNNKSKPQYRWEECYAKLVLESLFPERFFQLEFADKPDLQNRVSDMGIEVTTAVPEREKKLDSLYSKLENSQGKAEQRERYKNTISRLGGIYLDEGIAFNWADYDDPQKRYSAFEQKLKKLNGGGYTMFDKQYIFITDKSMCSSNQLEAINAELSNIQAYYSSRFDSVFLYFFGGALFEFNLRPGKLVRYTVDDVMGLVEEAYNLSQGVT